MAASMDSVSEKVRATLEQLSAEDRTLFQDEREKLLRRELPAGPLLDQLCCLRVVLLRLSEGYAQALASFERGLEQKTDMTGGWRKSVTRKTEGEWEAPMPWLHPFKLARDDLQAWEGELEGALAKGETQEREFGRLQEVLDKHELGLPLPAPNVQAKFRPGAVKVFK